MSCLKVQIVKKFRQNSGGNRLFSWTLFLLLFLVLFTFGCSTEEEEEEETTAGTVASDSEAAATFSTTSKEILKSAIIELPESLQGSGSSSGRSALRQNDGSGGMTGIFAGITHYVALADRMKDFVKEIMGHMVDPFVLKIPLGTIYNLDEDARDPDAPKKIMVEKPTGATYEWKISLYFTAASTAPEMIIRFTLEGESARGRIVFKMTEEDEDLAKAGFSGIEISRSIDVIFDGVGTTKTLEVKVVQDLSKLRSYATTNWSTLSASAKSTLDLGQPDKVFVNAAFDGTVFTIYGTSYHPGWEKEATLNGEDTLWGAGRSMYLFKAKALAGTTEGAKLYLALPKETTTDVSNVFTADSVSELFTDMMVRKLNGYITQQVTANKNTAFAIMQWILGDSLGLPSLTKHGSTFTQAEYDAAKTYWTGTDVAQLFQGVTSATALNNYIKTLPAVAGPNDKLGQDTLYTLIMAPTASALVTAHGYTVSKKELDTFLATDASTDKDKLSFQKNYETVKYMINPAYYNKTSGFLGTYNETASAFYKYSGSGFSKSTDESSISSLKSLDLSAIKPYLPADVVKATITIE